MKLHNRRDATAGAMFLLVGVSFAIGAFNYSFGSSARPGPAYFPFGLGVLLAVLGAVIGVRALVSTKSSDGPTEPLVLKPLIVIVASILSFAITLPLLGMAFALPILIAIISLAGDQFRWRDVVLSSLVLTVGCWAVFIKGLGLTLPMWPSFL